MRILTGKPALAIARYTAIPGAPITGDSASGVPMAPTSIKTESIRRTRISLPKLKYQCETPPRPELIVLNDAKANTSEGLAHVTKKAVDPSPKF